MFCRFIYNLVSVRQVWCRYEEIEVFLAFQRAATGRTELYVIRYLRRRIGGDQFPRMQDNSVRKRCVHFFCYGLGRGIFE